MGDPIAGTEPTREELERDKLMLDMEKMRADMRHQDRLFALELRRMRISYMAAGAGIFAGGAGFIGALLIAYRAFFE